MRAEGQNLTRGALDLMGGHVLPALGAVVGDWPEQYLELLGLSGAVRVVTEAQAPVDEAQPVKRPRGRPPKTR